MSLFGALSLGGSSLAAQQTGLQVTGNNIANAGTEGYTRQTVRLTPGGPQQVAPGQFLGTGVEVAAIERQANEAINESLRDATSGQASAQTLDTLLSRMESTFGALNENDLNARLTDFFNSFSALANNPSDSAQRATVITGGASVAGFMQGLRTQLSTIREDAQTQVAAIVTQADSLCTTIANLNQRIAVTEGGQGGANTLRDQRDQALSQLSQIMDIRVIDQSGSGGSLTVLVGSMPLITGTTTRGVSSLTTTDATTNLSTTQITFGDNGDIMAVSGGKLGAMTSGLATYVNPAIQTVDSLAAGLISAVNSIHTQGQGIAGFSSVTGTTAVLDPTAPLDAGLPTTGITFTPRNGTFNLYITDNITGQVTTKQIAVSIPSVSTTLTNLATQITAAGTGVVTASVTTAGKLAITSSNSNVTFGFGDDTSGVLSALGINTFFAGTDASNISVNSILNTKPELLATGRGNIKGSNGNAQALALAGTATASQFGGKNIINYYQDYIGNLAAHAKNATDDVTAQNAIKDTIFAQQQAISGVSLDEEAINLTKYQRAFQGTARFIGVVDELMQTVLGLVR